MSKISYRTVGKSGSTEVLLDEKVVGYIREESPPYGSPVPKIWRYWPKGALTQAAAGSAFTSINACKRSLEHE